MKILVLIAALTFGHQQKVDPLISKIQEYNESLYKLERPKDKTVYYFDYTTEFYYWDESMMDQKVRTKMYIGENHLYYLSNVVDLFMDSEYVATILKEQNQIVITRAVQDYDPHISITSTAQLQNKVLSEARIISIKDLNNGLKELKLDPKPVKIDNLYIESLIYHCDPGTGMIKKTITEYNQDYDLKKMVYEQHEMNLNSAYKNFKSVKKILFKPNGELQDKYTGYEIIVD